jgi:hypothetical protein
MGDMLRWWKGALLSHDHDFRLGEPCCRVFGCSARRRLQENEATLAILAAALKRRSITDLPLWLMVPRSADGRTVVDELRDGKYDRARLLAYTSLWWERHAAATGADGGAGT